MQDDYYAKAWQLYYDSQRGAGIPWDVSPHLAAGKDLARFADAFDPRLCVLDLGCGLGTQSVFLRAHFPSVLGVDVSSAAINHANEMFAVEGLTFRVFDILDPYEVQNLSANGPFNIYMRGLLQQILPRHRSVFVEHLERLMRADGVLYFNELSGAARQFFVSKSLDEGGLPIAMQRVLQQGVTKLTGVDLTSLRDVFPGKTFRVIKSGEGTVHLSWNAQVAEAPSVWGIVRLQSGLGGAGAK